jgi:hypothetical protein
MRYCKIIPILFVAMVMVASCKKDPGEGGNSSLYGKVFVKDYDPGFTVLQESYYGPDIWVYIIYGNDKSYGDRKKTSYDGTFEFKYLRPGTYHVYTFSKDSSLQTLAEIAVIRDVEITKTNQDVEVPLMTIFN